MWLVERLFLSLFFSAPLCQEEHLFAVKHGLTSWFTKGGMHSDTSVYISKEQSEHAADARYLSSSRPFSLSFVSSQVQQRLPWLGNCRALFYSTIPPSSGNTQLLHPLDIHL